MLTCLAAFQPIRLLPLEDLTISAVVNPVEKKDSFITIKISGFKHQGSLNMILATVSLSNSCNLFLLFQDDIKLSKNMDRRSSISQGNCIIYYFGSPKSFVEWFPRAPMNFSPYSVKWMEKPWMESATSLQRQVKRWAWFLVLPSLLLTSFWNIDLAKQPGSQRSPGSLPSEIFATSSYLSHF